MMSEHLWQEIRLGDCLAIKHGYAFKGEFFTNEGSHVVLTPGNFYEEGGFKDKGDKEKYYSGPIPEEYVLSKGDLIVAMTEQAEGLLGSAALVPQSNCYLHNQRLGLVQNLDNLEKQFLYYLFNSQSVRQQIRASCSGVKVRHTSPARIYEVKAKIPPLPTQRKIVAILSAYDDLIENNLRRIQILEEMAQNLYREWFVHFRYPGHADVPLVDSPLGPIPQGWESLLVEQIVTRVSAGKKYDQKSVKTTGQVPVLDQGKSGIIGYHDGKPGVVASEDIPIIVFANHTCHQRLVMFSFSTIQNVLPFVSHPQYPRNIFWLHYATQGLVNFNDYKGHWPEFMAKELVVPSSDICQEFGVYVEPLTRLVFKLERKNFNLRRTRDLLLPKLISGELDVSQLDIALPAEVAE